MQHDDSMQTDGRRALKVLLLHDRHMPTKELHARLKSQGFFMTSFCVSSMRLSFLHDLRVLRDADHLRKLPLSKRRRSNRTRKSSASATPRHHYAGNDD